MTLLAADISGADFDKQMCKDLLAECPTWRRVCGVTTSAQAAEKIYINSLPDPIGKVYTAEENNAVRPWALIELADYETDVGHYSDGPDSFSTGMIELTLTRNAPASDDGEPTGESHDEWCRFVGMMGDELRERNGRAKVKPLLLFKRLRMLRPWGSTAQHAAHFGVWQGAGFVFTW